MGEQAWRTIHVPGQPRLAADVMGRGPLLVFLHGIGGNRGNWHDQLPAFAPHVTAAAWDARGYGGSDDYPGPLAFADFLADLERLIDHLGAERAHLCGLSMGGRIALAFAASRGARVASLTLCDTHAGFAEWTPERRAEFVRLRQAPLLAGKEPRDIAPEVARTLVSERARPGAYERLVGSMAALRKASYLKAIAASVESDDRLDLAAIRAPTHVVVGEDDRLTPPATARELARRIAGAALTVIPEAGHLSNIEQPERFNAAVLGWLRPRL